MFELTLPTMTCGHCVKTVTETVRGVDAQAAVEFDLAQHKVTITSSLPRATFELALRDIGYASA